MGSTVLLGEGEACDLEIGLENHPRATCSRYGTASSTMSGTSPRTLGATS